MFNFQELDAKLYEEVSALIDFIDEKVINEELNKRFTNFYKVNLGPSQGLLESAPLYLQQLATNFVVSLCLGVSYPFELSINSPIKQQIAHISELLCSLNIVQIEGFKLMDSLFNKTAREFLAKRLGSNYDFLAKAANEYKTASYESGVVKTFADLLLEKQREKLAKEKIKSFYFWMLAVEFILHHF